MREEAGEQGQQCFHILHRRAGNLMPILIEDGGDGILEYDVITRVAFAEFCGDLFFQIIRLIHRFPIAERHAQPVEQCAIQIDAVALVGDPIIFRNKLQVLRLAPALEAVLKRLTQNTFTPAARYRFHPVKLGAIFVDQLAAHTRFSGGHYRGGQVSAGLPPPPLPPPNLFQTHGTQCCISGVMTDKSANLLIWKRN